MMKYLCLAALTCMLPLHAEPLKITAISYNVRNDNQGDTGERDWGARKDKVSGYLLDKKASIVGLQEVKHNQLLDLAKAMPGHQSVGAGRIDGKTAGEYSPVFYDSKLWQADPTDQGTFWLSDTPRKPNSKTWGNRTTRICSWVRLAHTKTGQSVYVYNTHWDHINQHSREKSAELILEKIRSRKHRETPFLLMGDFNANTENKAIKILLASGILTDPGKKQFSTSSMWQAPLRPGLRIDHIFVSKHWQNTQASVESNGKPTAASDHHPVVLTGALPQ